MHNKTRAARSIRLDSKISLGSFNSELLLRFLNMTLIPQLPNLVFNAKTKTYSGGVDDGTIYLCDVMDGRQEIEVFHQEVEFCATNVI
jgi:hypothetical protein